MTPSGQTICLSMIVKNEAPVIRRCLASVLPLIDYWIIVDTGSTDATQQIISEAMASLPGMLYERPWRDFGHNRSEALALARPHGTYSLIIDADDELVLEAGFMMPDLDADSYVVDIADAGIAYQRTQLVKNALQWRYEGVLHEFLTCEGARSVGRAPLLMRRNHDGRRRRDPDTYRNDAAILERALATEANPFFVARYTFYVAQSYRDCGDSEASVEAYLRRASLGHWDQEIFVSLCQAGRLMERLGRDPDDVIAVYQRATEACPSRAEAAHGASRLCRNLGQYQRGYDIAKPAIGLAAPADGLFVEPWIYHYGLLDEYAVNAYWAGDYQACAKACRKILGKPSVPPEDRKRIEKNLEFALDKLDRAATLATPELAVRAPALFSHWTPNRALGGTELMLEGLKSRLKDEIEGIDLHVNSPGKLLAADKPNVVWIHHDVDQAAVQWCRDRNAVRRVSRFVFVSYWQRERYVRIFDLPPERCIVIRNATTFNDPPRHWRPGERLAVAYTSTPFRGLSVLLDAWEALKPQNARLHVWSSMKLYGPPADDDEYRPMFERVARMEGVSYEGLLPNDALKERLRSIDILAYPCTFAETSCLSVIEAMAAGCRVICPSVGALSETTFDFARIYAAPSDAQAHAMAFARELEAELACPWGGKPHLSRLQQEMSQAFYDWDRHVEAWRDLIRSLGRSPAGT